MFNLESDSKGKGRSVECAETALFSSKALGTPLFFFFFLSPDKVGLVQNEE